MAKKKGVTPFGRFLGATWYVLVCGIFLAGGTAIGLAKRSPLFWKMVSSTITGPPKPTEVFKSSATTFLILGCDEDLYYQGQTVLKHKARSDMMLVARMDFKKGEITGVSIPRDTWCKLPGYDEHKINAYHAIAKWGQEDELAKQAVEHTIGVDIDKVITIDYTAFQKLVDLVGGVKVRVTKKMDYDDNAGNLHVHLTPGIHKLNGYDAMCYVRYRHSSTGEADTDFQRQDRQKDFLVGFKASVLNNIFSLPEIVDSSKAVLGGALNDDQIQALAFFSKGVKPNKIRLGVVPTTEEGKGLRVDRRKLPDVLAQFGLTQQEGLVSLNR